ncbi:hypothetical protein Daus18300_001238 [Diaporthe australafricana]|uniref:Tat pathway signal sequence n=1 Tax=Diaporthe australafricana TaxID=127596 RepID=A0ABR3XYA9_9PEZI
MNSTNDGNTVAEGSTPTAGPAHPASGQQPNVSAEAKARLTDTIGQSGEHTTDMAGGSSQVEVKTDPEAEASPPATIPDVSSDMIDRQHEGSPVQKKKNALDMHLSDLSQQTEHIALDHVKKAADYTDLAKLEASTETARRVLDSLRRPLADSKQRQHLERLDRLKSHSQRTRTVVAVAGATGAGKSSLINALLDEEKLLPTSSYRACTAVVTEISYNESKDAQKAYRAEVEFISQDDWESELKLLHGDLVEDKRLSAAYLDDNAEAGIAYAKIKAVYPDLTHDMIVKSKVAQLAERGVVANVLGKTRKIACRNARELYKSLRKYLDSKDKDTEGRPRKQEDISFWPLIKVVKIFTRASVLQTGLVLVDVPGLGDSNLARCAVARNYMTECSAIWVAAPIKRAVDDEAARKLMGMSSRLQMKLDGMYSHVTFICTMTDSVQLSEIEEDFDEDGQLQTIRTRGEDLEEMIRAKTESIKQLEEQLSDGNISHHGLTEEHDTWRALQKNHMRGQKVYQPRVPAKRKHYTGPVTRSSRRAIVDDDSEEEDTADQNPLTTDEISSKRTEIKGKLTSKDTECADMEKRLEIMRDDLIAFENEKKDIAVETTRLCIQKRSDYVKKAIRIDFANGIREIDEADAEADDEHFDPSVKQRDYAQISRSLPIFCVSSKAYQQLRLQKKRETRVEGFRSLTDSEVPILQQHARELPEQGRMRIYKTFLNEFCGILGSLAIWADSSLIEHDTQVMSKFDRSYEEKLLHAAAENLKKDLEVLIWANMSELDSIVQNKLQSKSDAAIDKAVKDMANVVSNWTAKKCDGGLAMAYNTYRAICRRDGSNTKSKMSRDFNEDILEPYLKKIAARWEQVFGHSIPRNLDNLLPPFKEKLVGFHSMISSRPGLQYCKTASLHNVGEQIMNHVRSMRAEVVCVKAKIQGEQRQASRAFVPEIRNQMAEVYQRVAEEAGEGCFMRMKTHMSTHIHKKKDAIYREATNRVMSELKGILQANRNQLVMKAHNIIDLLEADFKTVISSTAKVEATEVARGHIRAILQNVDVQFEELLCTEPMDVDSVQLTDAVPQQSSIMGNAGVGDTTGELVETGSMAEPGAMDTGL